METIQLVAAKRTAAGKAVQALRAAGKVPAVIYGRGIDSESIEVDSREIAKIYAQAGGNKIVALKVGSGKARNVLIHDVQEGSLRGELQHVDFYAVRMDELLTAEIPLHFVGESDAVYKEEGTLLKQLEAVEVECLPADLPESIEVDISVLSNFETTITLGDLTLPKGVTLVDEDMDQLIAKVEPPRTEAEMAELDEGVTEELPEAVAEEQSTKDDGSDQRAKK